MSVLSSGTAHTCHYICGIFFVIVCFFILKTIDVSFNKQLIWLDLNSKLDFSLWKVVEIYAQPFEFQASMFYLA